MTSYDGPRIGGAAVQPNTKARGASVSGDAAVVGHKGVQWVFGGDTTLQRVAVQLHLVLGRETELNIPQPRPLRETNLRLHDIDPRDLFGDGMFDLDPRVDLDEVKSAGFRVHEEFERARAFVSGVPSELQGERRELIPPSGVEIGRRCPLDDFLIPALDGAVPFKEVNHVAVLVAQDLHLDVPSLLDQFFEKDLALTESGQRLPTARLHFPL